MPFVTPPPPDHDPETRAVDGVRTTPGGVEDDGREHGRPDGDGHETASPDLLYCHGILVRAGRFGGLWTRLPGSERRWARGGSGSRTAANVVTKESDRQGFPALRIARVPGDGVRGRVEKPLLMGARASAPEAEGDDGRSAHRELISSNTRLAATTAPDGSSCGPRASRNSMRGSRNSRFR